MAYTYEHLFEALSKMTPEQRSQMVQVLPRNPHDTDTELFDIIGVDTIKTYCYDGKTGQQNETTRSPVDGEHYPEQFVILVNNHPFIGMLDDGMLEHVKPSFDDIKNGIVERKAKRQKTVDKDGTISYKLNGQLHREDGPAIEWANGTKMWYINGLLHREDGPAIEYASGNKYWYINGQQHREDGPAVEYADGTKHWWINDKKLTEEEFNKPKKSKLGV